MPLDPRIPLMADQIVLPDRLAAQQRRQQVQANRMAMEAQQATAQRNAMLRSKASLVDFTSPQQTASFASLGEGTEPYVENATRVQSMATAQSAQARAAAEEERKHRDEGFKLIGQGLLGALADPSDMGLTTIRSSLEAQGIPADQLEPIIGPIMRLPPGQRTGAIRQFVATNETARQALEFVSPKPEEVDFGGTIAFIDMNPNSPTYRQRVSEGAKTADPNRPVQIVQGETGAFMLPPGGGAAAPVVDVNGDPIGLPPTAQQQNAASPAAAQAQRARSQAAEIMSESARVMQDQLAVLRDENFVRNANTSTAGNLGQFARDLVPGVRGAALAANPRADTASGVIQGTISTMLGQLRNLYGTSSKAMDAVREMELALARFGSEGMTYEASMELLDAEMRRADRIAQEYVAEMGGAGATPAQGGGQYREGEVRYNSAGDGVRYTNGQWVPL